MYLQARVFNVNIMQTVVLEVLKILDSIFLCASAAALNLMRNYVAHLCMQKCRYFWCGQEQSSHDSSVGIFYTDKLLIVLLDMYDVCIEFHDSAEMILHLPEVSHACLSQNWMVSKEGP